jgi:hypothetical protein
VVFKLFIYAGKNGYTGYFPNPVANECLSQFCKTSDGWLLQIDAVGMVHTARLLHTFSNDY